MNRIISIGFSSLIACLVGCDGPCAVGTPCERICGPEAVATCAAEGLCTCVPVAASAEADGGPGATCRAPDAGDLVINEVLLDGEPDESAEFIELVNVSDDPLALAGLVLSGRRGEGQSRRVSFEGGCIGPGTAVALYAQQADWRWSEPALEPVTAVLNAFGFANDGPFEFRLEDPAGRLLSLAEGFADDAEPGVSLNRQPDLVGETFVAHSPGPRRRRVSGDLSQSRPICGALPRWCRGGRGAGCGSTGGTRRQRPPVSAADAGRADHQ